MFLWKSPIFVLLILALTLGACGPAKAPTSGLQGTIAVSGAFALYPMMVTWAEAYQKINPGVRIDVSAGGAGKGMADTLAGAVDIGMVSRQVTVDEMEKGAVWFAVVKDAVFPTVSAKNPVLPALMSQGVEQSTFIRLYMDGDLTTWGELTGQSKVQDEIHLYTRSDSSGAAEIWAKYLDGMQEDLLGIGVFGDPGIMDAVVKDPLGIGYNNLNYAFDAKSGKPVEGAVVLPIDVSGNGKADPEEVLDTRQKAITAVASGRYPSPPARDLNLVTKGQPTGLVQDFLLWVLNQGQQYVDQAGYVSLPDEYLAEQQDKIK